MTFADDWLRVHPEDINVLRLYAAFAQARKQAGRLDACLRAGIASRPVRVEWNRIYQTLHDRPAERVLLLVEYDAMLHAEPENSALMYLRGRIELDRALALDYYRRAAAADPRNPFPPFALGYDRMAAGDWVGARPLFAHAVELDAADAGFANWLFLTRLALGEAPALEQELRKQLAHDPYDFLAGTRLIDVLAAREQFDDALKISGDFARRCRAKFHQEGEFLANAIQYRACYGAGNFEKLKTAANADRTAAGRLALASAMIEQGQVDAAVKLLPPNMDSDDSENFQLAIAVAYRQSGNSAAAEQWQQRFVESLQNGNGSSVQAAGLLTRSTPPTRKEVEDVAIPPQLKATLLAALCQQHPQARAELAGLARELNVERVFPFYLVRNVTGQAP
jgi:tetratricopeptide (TPR) repeat protein